jgi:hypothetical protein
MVARSLLDQRPWALGWVEWSGTWVSVQRPAVEAPRAIPRLAERYQGVRASPLICGGANPPKRPEVHRPLTRADEEPSH